MGAGKGWGVACEPQQELLAETKRIVNPALISPCGSVWPGNPRLPLQESHLQSWRWNSEAHAHWASALPLSHIPAHPPGP